MHSQRSRRQGRLSPPRGRKPRPTVPLPPGCAEDSIVLTFEVPPDLAGQRLDRFLQQRIPRVSRARAQAIIRACAYREDGTRRRPSDIVREGEVVVLVRERFEEPEVPLHFDVLLDDGAVLAVDKPSGLPMHPTATYHKHTLSYLLRERYADAERVPSLAHRLDRETSGVVLCGHTKADVRNLKQCFEQHQVEKVYLAIARGRMPQDEGRIDLPMAPTKERLHVLMEIQEDGLSASTQYRVLARAADHTLVELRPASGRQHQLRLHLSALGHPIVGDKLYGPEREAPFLEVIDTGMTESLLERLGHDRQALHAHRISLPHPRTGESLTLQAPFPEDLRALWAGLEGATFDPAAAGL